MRVCIVTEINLETGDYEVTVRNLSAPGTDIDLEWLQRVWLRVHSHWVAQAQARHAAAAAVAAAQPLN